MFFGSNLMIAFFFTAGHYVAKLMDLNSIPNRLYEIDQDKKIKVARGHDSSSLFIYKMRK